MGDAILLVSNALHIVAAVRALLPHLRAKATDVTPASGLTKPIRFGSIMEIVARGAADIYLTSPGATISYFRVKHSTHTNFATEPIAMERKFAASKPVHRTKEQQKPMRTERARFGESYVSAFGAHLNAYDRARFS